MPKTLQINGRLWFSTDEGPFLGHGRVLLLKKINETGSISKAAVSMKMSYKKAWSMVNSMNTILNKPLVDISLGGKNGGGSTLSETGKLYLSIFEDIHIEQEAFIKHSFLEKLNALEKQHII
jgi:molybdate transport system regulatory protein